MRFEYESRQQRVCFGSGQAAQTLARELERLDVSKVTVIAAGTASDLADRVTTSLPVVLRYDDVVMHLPE
jgi:maleylacetate reductase